MNYLNKEIGKYPTETLSNGRKSEERSLGEVSLGKEYLHCNMHVYVCY